MEGDLVHDVESGLKETRANLREWMESASEGKLETQLGAAGTTAVQEHLHVVGQTLEKVEAGTFGICEVCHEPVDEALLRMDYTSCICLGHFTEPELRELERELELSQVVQRALLPQRPPSIPGIDTAGFSRPAKIVSGDYFDFVRFKDGSHGVIVGDVSGKGVSAAMLMTSLQTAFQTMAPEATSPLEILERINRLYLHNIKFTTFVTLFVGQYEPRERRFTYANAGHNSGYLLRGGTGEEQWLHPTGPAIGLTEGRLTRVEAVELRPGDNLLLYTDGVTEATNAAGEFFGEDRLAAAMQQNAAASAEGLVQAVVKDLADFTQRSETSDDTTLVLLKAR